MKKISKRQNSESGNAFFIVIITVGLFAALMFSFSRSAQQGSGDLSHKQAEIFASDIMDYAQKIERATGRVLSRGFSETALSYENDMVSGYSNANCTSDRCKIFENSGGAVNWQSPTRLMNGGAEWIITGGNYVKGLGSAGDISDSELLLILPDVRRIVCQEINARLGIASPGESPPQENGDSDTTFYTGSFSASPELIEEAGGTALDGKTSGCFEGDSTPPDGTYHFYHVLLQRP